MSAESLVIRPATPADAAAVAGIFQYYVENTKITLSPTAPKESYFSTLIKATLERYPFLVADKDGEVVGYAYLKPFNEQPSCQWSAETSIYLDKDAVRQGVGTVLYTALEAAAKAQGIVNLYLCITYVAEIDKYRNDTSLVFHEKMGYRKEGEFEDCGFKDGHWYSNYWMQKNIAKHRAEPEPFVPFAKLTPEQLAEAGIQ